MCVCVCVIVIHLCFNEYLLSVKGDVFLLFVLSIPKQLISTNQSVRSMSREIVYLPSVDLSNIMWEQKLIK